MQRYQKRHFSQPDSPTSAVSLQAVRPASAASSPIHFTGRMPFIGLDDAGDQVSKTVFYCTPDINEYSEVQPQCNGRFLLSLEISIRNTSQHFPGEEDMLSQYYRLPVQGIVCITTPVWKTEALDGQEGISRFYFYKILDCTFVSTTQWGWFTKTNVLCRFIP